jgi:putative membrane protein
MTPSERDGVERRLHPWSWLFVLLQQLRQFIVPLVAAFFFGGDRNELWPLIGVGVLTITAALQYLTYRYAVGADALTIRSGWLHRQRREIPYARIHNVSVEQTVLHRLFGVAELRLESAGGSKPEATMRVLRMDDALALERLVRHRGASAPMEAGEQAVAPASEVLLELPVGEVLRLGLISNRGLLVIATAWAASMQMGGNFAERMFVNWAQSVYGYADEHHYTLSQTAFASVLLIALAMLALRALSIVLALVQFYGFRLSEEGTRLTIERGLLSRSRSSAGRRRLQAYTLYEGFVHRLLKRRSLHVDTAGASDAQGGGERRRSMHELAPIATPDKCDALIEHLLPDAGWHTFDWRPLHRYAGMRVFLGSVWFPVVAAAVGCWYLGAWGLLALAWLPWAWFVAQRHARHAGYALNGRLVIVRGGWWSRYWRFAEIDKLQALRVSRGPLDRRWGMATLWLDTAGANMKGPPLRIAHVPAEDAQALCDHLARMLAARKLRW